jgi:uncharacterized protein (DUF697 family)
MRAGPVVKILHSTGVGRPCENGHRGVIKGAPAASGAVTGLGCAAAAQLDHGAG